MPDLIDISIFVHPVETGSALKKLRKKAAQVESQLYEKQEKGIVRDPMLETAFQDIESLRDSLQQAREHLFNVGVYITIYAEKMEDLNKLEDRIINLLESRMVYVKPSLFQQIEGFNSSIPLCQDKLTVYSPLNSGPLSSFFPFTSADLTSEDGILYGINESNNTLIIFDRFSLENANMVIFAKSGGGKSYATKL
jgi:type IV secretory pathway VirB4 component